MIKLEHKILNDKRVIAFKLEASREEDLKALDLLAEAIMEKKPLEMGFLKSDTMIIHVKDMDNRHFEESGSSNQK